MGAPQEPPAFPYRHTTQTQSSSCTAKKQTPGKSILLSPAYSAIFISEARSSPLPPNSVTSGIFSSAEGHGSVASDKNWHPPHWRHLAAVHLTPSKGNEERGLLGLWVRQRRLGGLLNNLGTLRTASFVSGFCEPESLTHITSCSLVL